MSLSPTSSQLEDQETVDRRQDQNRSVPSSEGRMHTVMVYDGRSEYEMEVEHGRTHRDALRDHNLSPHGWLTQHLNCDGQGHCSACAVEVTQGNDRPEQWLDAFLNAQGLGRLSCQIDVTEDMAVRV